MSDPLPYDPCVAYTKLRDAYQSVLSGETVKSVRFKSGEDERQADFAPADISLLKQAMTQAREDCAKSVTGRGTRFAIQGGYIPDWRGWR